MEDGIKGVYIAEDKKTVVYSAGDKKRSITDGTNGVRSSGNTKGSIIDITKGVDSSGDKESVTDGIKGVDSGVWSRSREVF